MMKEVHIRIGMRWNHPSIEVICRETERFLGWLTQFEATHLDQGERIPIHWNLPSDPFLEIRTRNLDDLVLEIKTRIQSKKDIPISMGYSGGFHPLLTIDELTKECEWGISNPWDSGIRDTFGKTSPFIIPFSPDLLRADAVSCYVKHEFSAVGINRNTVSQVYFENTNNSPLNSLALFFFLPLSPYLVLQCKRDMRKVLEEHNYTLSFFFDCMYIEEVVKVPFDFKPFSEILESLMSKYSVHFTSFDTIPDFSTVIQNFPSDNPGDILPNHPLWRQNAARIRNDRAITLKSARNMKDILKTISPLYLIMPGKKVPKSDEKEKNRMKKINFPQEDRINTADMQGQVTLSGDTFSVLFRKGKIKNFLYKKKKVLTGEIARSYISFSNYHYDLESMSAFSIAGDKCRGMREIQKIIIEKDEPYGTQLTDYIFVGDFPYLIITTKVTYPNLSSYGDVEQHALFEIPLFYIKKEKHIDLHIYSDNHRECHSFAPEERVFSLTGSAFVFSKDSVSIIAGFPPGKGPDLQILGLQISKKKKGLCLSINIGGSYFRVPASYYSRVTEIFSFYLGVCQSPGDEIPFFPAQVLHEIPENTVFI